jgi:hypothetical protein
MGAPIISRHYPKKAIEVLQELRDYAARFGLTIEEKSEP